MEFLRSHHFFAQPSELRLLLRLTTAGQLLHIPHKFQLQAINMVSLVMFFLTARVGLAEDLCASFATVVLPALVVVRGI
jgi:hypothetical protein